MLDFGEFVQHFFPSNALYRTAVFVSRQNEDVVFCTGKNCGFLGNVAVV